MDGTPRDTTPDASRDRHFDPSKIPAGPAADALVSDLLQLIADRESRQRARKPQDQALHVSMVRALVLDLADRALREPEGWLAVSLQVDQYTTRRRKASFLTGQFPALVKWLGQDRQLIELRKGERSHFGAGKRTTIRAGTKLLELIEKLDLSDIRRDPKLRGDPLVLRSPKLNGKAHDLRFPETDSTRAMRGEVEAINEWLMTADLWWAGDELEDNVDSGDRFLRRIFNNGEWHLGGRLFGGFWQGKKSEVRLECIRFGDQPAVSLDFGQMAVRTAYSMVGAEPPPGDLYYIPGRLQWNRDGVKRVLNALLACESIPKRFPAGTRSFFKGKWDFTDDVLSPLVRHHAPIARLFGTSRSLELMHRESDLLIKILLRLMGHGVVALPVHDCLLVGEKDQPIAQQVMEDTFRELLGMEGVVSVTRLTTPVVNPSVPL